jgi:hypothetical protein
MLSPEEAYVHIVPACGCLTTAVHHEHSKVFLHSLCRAQEAERSNNFDMVKPALHALEALGPAVEEHLHLLLPALVRLLGGPGVQVRCGGRCMATFGEVLYDCTCTCSSNHAYTLLT